MAPKKKKAPANKNTPTVSTNPSAGIIGNMYRGLSSSTPPAEVRANSSGDALRDILGSGRGFSGLPFGSTGNDSTGSGSTPTVTPSITPDVTPDVTPEADVPEPITLVSTSLDDYGNTIGFYSDGTSKQLLSSGNKYRSNVDVDAYALLQRTFEDNGLPEFAKIIEGYMDRGIGPEQAKLEIRTNPVYTKRFKGNENRKAAGLNTISEAEYLDLENSYMQTLKSYGLANQLGADKASRQAAMADIIGNDVAATEFKDRIDTVVTRVKNADPTVKSTMTSFFGIKEEDLIGYFINPKENLPKLQEKVTAAEIGAAARGQDLATSVAGATALAQFGVTQAQAREGYSAIGEVLPTARKLGEIYGDAYTQDIAEQEVFKGSASAKRKREQLAQREAASFAGSSGRLRTGQMQGNTGSF
jgi:hypothetical protein